MFMTVDVQPYERRIKHRLLEDMFVGDGLLAGLSFEEGLGSAAKEL